MEATMVDEYNVYWTDCEGEHHTEMLNGSPEQAVNAAHRLCTGPATILGIVARVIITDGGDFTNFEWKKDEGITYPKQYAGIAKSPGQ
jgi:hypothetical protein